MARPRRARTQTGSSPRATTKTTPGSRDVARLRVELATLKAIAEAGHAAAPDELLRELLQLVATATKSTHASIYLLDPSGAHDLVHQGSVGPTTALDRWGRISVTSTSLGDVVATQKSLRQSAATLPGDLPEVMPTMGLKHGLAVSMQIQGRSIGVLNLWRARSYARADAATAELLADPIAMQLERARLDAETRRRAQDLSLLNELGRVIAEQLDLESVLSLGLELVVHMASVAHGFVLLCEGESIRFAASTLREPMPPPIRPDETSAVNLAIRDRRPVVSNDVRSDPRVSADLVARFQHTALLALPMLTRGDVIGVIVLGHTDPERRFLPEDVDRAVALSNELATAVVNARLFEEAMANYHELRRTQEHLVQRERLAALGELAAVVAHEIRNPLAVIFNSVASLRRKSGGEDASAGLLLDIVGEEAERINHIIGDLLDFARPGEPRVARHDMEIVLAGALEAARQATGKGGESVEVLVARPVSPISADAQLVRQALINLLVNALQADPHGRVRVRLHDETRRGRRFARIDVEDNGGGIDAAVLPHVFQPFFTTKAQGTGLGLAIVKRIADAHHGEVVVSSHGGATTFTLYLPSAAYDDDLA